MPVVLPDVKPSGLARSYQKFMAERGVNRSRAFQILHLPVAPQTFKIGSSRMIDEAIGIAWFQALSEGQFQITAADLAETKADAA
ncbi:MAG: hypothetical protein ABJZ79_16605 [Parasphingorhabdus sp.]|uniref:hypothetical protein n=1 Tax=Parasphingorhabdus sp. TaxID=2709688 RepID=UPI00329A324C